ncbi:radical SAM family heme chaperone HemW [Tessaracoccus sp. OS52]|uniref:radical SAM family heme chaperone HemW n=1 Tax=Tessaracoccus sp. OS52 TaxID=2886691 RepID=UPI001D12E063|nr:radical SAM family heme chaperone HemW [Tessaracoccus sp. OS52]MCC2592671.1 radical SAM family heme chaperone HemW [Tessaracoccus sp. OS52]
MPSQLPDGVSLPSDGALPASALSTVGSAPLSFYLHVPFCRTRCGYCDFNTYTASELPGMTTSGYVAGALAEIRLARRVLGDDAPPVSTVFFGGGTPTMLPSSDLALLLGAVREEFGLVPDAEVTTEANPDTVDPHYFSALREAGFTRISLGMQSVVPHVLQVLERVHTAGRGLDAARWASEAGFEHVSLDLIYGTPGESTDDWRRSLEAVAATPVDHVSAYSLIVEEGTRLALQVRRGEVPMPDDDVLADKYLMAEQYLTGQGFANYEVSNWATRESGRCRHNLAYWRGSNWWGVGPGAHSHVGGVRFWNRKHPRSWVQELEQGRSPAQAGEHLTDADRRVERVLLELRLAEGLPLEVLTPSERGRVADVVSAGLAVVTADRLVLTLDGRLLADGVVRDLLD